MWSTRGREILDLSGIQSYHQISMNATPNECYTSQAMRPLEMGAVLESHNGQRFFLPHVAHISLPGHVQCPIGS